MQLKPASSSPQGPPAQLRSWKEISTYLGVSVKTVQRWEKAAALPVHRIEGTKEVFAFPTELDSWKVRATRPKPPPSALRWLFAAVAGCLLVASGVLVLASLRAVPPTPARQDSAFLAGAAPKLLKIIPVGRQPTFSFRPAASRWVFVSNFESAEISVVDAESLRVVQTVAVDPKPTLMGGPADGSFICLLHSGGKITRIDTVDWKPRVLAQLNNHGSDLELSPDSKTGYVAASEGGVVKFDTSTGVVTPLRNAGNAFQLQLDASGRSLAVTYLFGRPCGVLERDCLEVIDTQSGQLRSSQARVPGTGMVPILNPRTGTLWVSSGDVCVRPHYKYEGCPYVPGSLMYSASQDFGELSPLASYRGGSTDPLWFTPDGLMAYIRVGATLLAVSGADAAPRHRFPVSLAGSYLSRNPSPVAFIPLIYDNGVAAIEWMITVKGKLLESDCPSILGRKEPPACIVIEPTISFDPTLIDVSSLTLDGVSLSMTLAKNPVYLGRSFAGARGFTNMVIPLARRLVKSTHELRGITTGGVVFRAEL